MAVTAHPRCRSTPAERSASRRCGHLGVERCQDLVGGLHQRHLQALANEVLGDLETDETAAGHRVGAGLLGGGSERIGVLDIAQGQCPRRGSTDAPVWHRAPAPAGRSADAGRRQWPGR